jgi:hypothetical protein
MTEGRRKDYTRDMFALAVRCDFALRSFQTSSHLLLSPSIVTSLPCSPIRDLNVAIRTDGSHVPRQEPALAIVVLGKHGGEGGREARREGGRERMWPGR